MIEIIKRKFKPRNGIVRLVFWKEFSESTLEDE
jgi:hypothetical protein